MKSLFLENILQSAYRRQNILYSILVVDNLKVFYNPANQKKKYHKEEKAIKIITIKKIIVDFKAKFKI